MFLDAPAVVQEALVRYVVEGERAASQIVRQVHRGQRLSASARAAPSPGPSLPRARRTTFTSSSTASTTSTSEAPSTPSSPGAAGGGALRARAGQAPRRSIKLGSYSATERLIRVHPALDRPWVPRYFVSYIVYHEMLHHVIPSSQGTAGACSTPPSSRPASGSSATSTGRWPGSGRTSAGCSAADVAGWGPSPHPTEPGPGLARSPGRPARRAGTSRPLLGPGMRAPPRCC